MVAAFTGASSWIYFIMVNDHYIIFRNPNFMRALRSMMLSLLLLLPLSSLSPRQDT